MQGTEVATITCSTVLTNCHVIDVENGGTLENYCLAIGTSGTIVALLPMSSVDVASLCANASSTLDCQGGYVIPGLIDCHVHVTAFTGNFAELEQTSPTYVTVTALRELEAMLRRGFTTVRDAGGADHGLARALAEGLAHGPRLLFCGKALSQTGGHGDMRAPGDFRKALACTCAGLGRICDGDAQVRQAARDEIRKGATHLKIMAGGGVASPTDRITSTQFSLGELRAIVEEAKAANIGVMAHAYTPRAILNCVQAGVDSIEHGNLLDDQTAAVMAQNGTYMVPTLATYHALQNEGQQNGLSPDMVDKVKDVLHAGLRSIGIALKREVTICYGSDLLANMRKYQLHGLSLMEQSGMTPFRVLKSATIDAARLIRMQDEIGSVTVGKLADLVVVRKNPLESTKVLEEYRENYLAVFRAGRRVKLTELGD